MQVRLRLMLKAIFAFVGRLLKAPPPTVVAPPRRAPDTVIGLGGRAMGAAAAKVPAANPSPASAVLGLGARRPLVAADGSLAGFEFYVGAATLVRLQRATGDAGDVASRAYAANVLGAMRLCASQNLAALAKLPTGWLTLLPDELLLPGMHLVLHSDSSAAEATPGAAQAQAAQTKLATEMARLRGAGVLLGWCAATAGAATPPGRPDFIALPAPATTGVQAWRDALTLSVSRWPGLPHMPHVLLELPDVDVMEAVLRPPVTLVACAIGANVVPVRVQALPPQAQRLLQLLHRLVRDDDNALLAQDIKADAALSLGLLHHLNTAGASPGRVLDSIEQAVTVLGRDALYGWVAQMLVRMSPQRPAAHYLQAMALARARFLELLARAAGEPSPGTLYLLGLASMLPLLLQCSLADAVDALPLPPQALAALHQQSGPWRPYLALAQALETHDMLAAETLAVPFGGLATVLGHSAKAWLLH